MRRKWVFLLRENLGTPLKERVLRYYEVGELEDATWDAFSPRYQHTPWRPGQPLKMLGESTPPTRPVDS